MAKEILAIPEENLAEVIKVIRVGLNELHPQLSHETYDQLAQWCNEQEQYLNSDNEKI